MSFLGLLKSRGKSSDNVSELANMRFKLLVVEFYDTLEYNRGEVLSKLLNGNAGLDVSLYDEPFIKDFLELSPRNYFDLRDNGELLLDKTTSDVLLWGSREKDLIRISMQNHPLFNNKGFAIPTILDSLYLPAEMLNSESSCPKAIANLIYGAVISNLHETDSLVATKKRELLKNIISDLSADNSAKNLSIEFLPYIMNYLGIIYHSYCRGSDNLKDFKIAGELFETAIKNQNLFKHQVHLGILYYHIALLNDDRTQIAGTENMTAYKNAIDFYARAARILDKHNYPYEYGYICYRLSTLFLNYWKAKENLQALRDAAFNLREAEQIFSFAVFPDFWAEIQGDLANVLSIISTITSNDEIAELAINSYKNQQRVFTEVRSPKTWARIQESIADLYYRLGKKQLNEDKIAAAIEYYKDALFVFENNKMNTEATRGNNSLTKAMMVLNQF